jgi:outer membrane protein assembly factor BamB
MDVEYNNTRTLPGSIQAVKLEDKVFGANIGIYAVNSWAFSLKKGQEGQLIHNTTWNPPSSWAEANRTSSVRLSGVDLDNGVFTVVNVDSTEHWGFSTDTGQLLWGPTEPQYYLEMYQEAMAFIACGRYLTGTTSGIIQSRNITTGALQWTYNAKDVYHENPVGNNWLFALLLQ